MKKQILLALFTCVTTLSLAQAGWKWPQDVDKAKEKNALYVDAVKSKDFAMALEPFNWLMENAPDLNESLYINGAKIYQGLEAAEKDPAKKIEYQIKAMKMYDDRIKYFGGEGSVLNRKAFMAYKYYKGDKAKYQELLDLFNKTFELNGEKVLDNNLAAYMDVVRRYKSSGGDISDDAVLDIYDVISQIIANRIAAKKKEDFFIRTQENVDKMLTMIVKVDCEFVENNLAPKMRETKDPKMSKKVFQLLLKDKCMDSPVFIEAAEMVFESEPAFGLAKVIAIKYTSASNTSKGDEWYNKALELTEDNLEKAEIYMSQAQVANNQGRKSDARSYARKALSNDPSLKDAYTLIGNLYFSSYQDCREGVSKVDDRLIFIAAYNQYAKAGNTAAMAKAKEQFPSIAEIFELGLSEGQSMTVGCWVNETVKLERRPN